MEKGAMLWILILVMLVGSCLAGSLPLVMSLSEDKLQLVSVLGAGLLVGTALAVIIPEGIRALFTGEITNEKQLHGDLHSLIGISLVLGFVFMLLIDQCSAKKSDGRQKSVTATLGLVVHAAVDGVALGAAATTSQADVEMIVFLAIMLHKAPAAFGLVSFLLHEGVDKKRISRHLLIFSLAAPCLTLVTYFGIGKVAFLTRRKDVRKMNFISSKRQLKKGIFLWISLRQSEKPFVLYLYLFIPQTIKQKMKNKWPVQFQDFLILFMPFERESFVPVRTFPTFVCTLMDSEIPTAKGEVQTSTTILFRMSLVQCSKLVSIIHEIIGGCEFTCAQGKETLNNVNATGLAMLFSAGTFLYVATVHVLPELMTRSSNYSHVPSVEGITLSATGLKVKEILFLVIGIFLPALITTGHHH
ncbi:Zinc transporter ZIP9-A [Atta colombica]|uniref:Zinc transporter ZIP9-A n=1 Tax=Atta colombica TaxID=520822 RepID=A0A151HYL6_9HYME|nr:Zinc transporter ZIP9-A [Atta colombica]